MDESKVQCGPLDFESVLNDYSRVVKYKKGSFDPIVGAHFTNELNGRIRQGDNSAWSQVCVIREFLFGFK